MLFINKTRIFKLKISRYPPELNHFHFKFSLFQIFKTEDRSFETLVNLRSLDLSHNLVEDLELEALTGLGE